jgi:predicted transcriptional regulator of viral defense system
MHISTDDHIVAKIRKSKSKKFFFIDDFVTIANYKAVNKALERLVERGVLTRVAKGIYARPKIDPLLGEMLPTTEQIAEAIAKRDKARIIPTGAYALHMLGLSTQIPMNVVYLTDSSARKVKVGKRTIVFKKTSPRNLAVKGKISSLVIQALKTIGKDKVSDEDIATIVRRLKKEDPAIIESDIAYAPEWIRKIMKQAL